MCNLEQILYDHKIWIELGTAIGTVTATSIALVVTCINWRRSRQEQRSAATLTDPREDGIVFLENHTNVDLKVSIERNDQLISDPQNKTSSSDYQQKLKLESIKKINGWKTQQNEIMLSPGQRIPIHLADLCVEKTYVALAGLKITTNGKTMYSVFRFAGQKAREDDDLSSDTHPHLSWVLVFQNPA